jgi:hypothetical protein
MGCVYSTFSSQVEIIVQTAGLAPDEQSRIIALAKKRCKQPVTDEDQLDGELEQVDEGLAVENAGMAALLGPKDNDFATTCGRVVDNDSTDEEKNAEPDLPAASAKSMPDGGASEPANGGGSSSSSSGNADKPALTVIQYRSPEPDLENIPPNTVLEERPGELNRSPFYVAMLPAGSCFASGKSSYSQSFAPSIGPIRYGTRRLRLIAFADVYKSLWDWYESTPTVAPLSKKSKSVASK